MGKPRVMLDCRAIRQPDLGDIDALLRIRLSLGGAGCRLVLEPCGRDLAELIRFAGLENVLAVGGSVQAGREPEERE